MSFAKEMLELRDELTAMGHDIILPDGIEAHLAGTIDSKKEKIATDAIRGHYQLIKKSDAILVPNYTKRGIENYVGGNALIEMGFAYVLRKKIYLLNSIPDINYRDEIEAVFPIVLNGDLTKITPTTSKKIKSS